MQQQFCASCGAQIDVTRQRFCMACGAPLTEEAYVAVMNEQAQWQAPMQTTPMPYMPAPQQPPRRKSKTGLIAIVCIAIVAVIAVAFIVLNMGSCSGSSTFAPQSSASTASEPADSSETSAVDADDDDDDADDDDADDDDADDEGAADEDADDDDADDDEVYDELNEAYYTMGGQADRIRDVAATLNNTIFKKDYAERTSAADAAYRLQDEVYDLLSDLEETSVPADSHHFGTKQTLIELQQDLCKRIDVICEAWDISLQHDNPKSHESEIRKPLGRDNDSKGVNIYKKDFESRFADARPQR